jgi:pimeloyl-ACP methyl ester carboxylesterase
MLSRRTRGECFKAAAGFVGLTAALMIVAPSAQGAEMSGAFVELPNVKLWVADTGGTGDPVILLHANTGTADAWQKQLPVLARAGYRAIAFDRPARGKSVVKAGTKPVSVTETLDALVDHLRLTKVHLIGIAGGGYVALDYAAWRPERLKSLVLAATGLGLALDEEALRFRKLAEIPGFRDLPAEVREMSPSYRGMNPDGVARWKEIYESAKAGGGPHAPELRTPNTYAKVASITTPTLVIAGGVDLTSPSGAIRLWARHLKGHEWVLIPEAGHSVAWEQPEAFNEAVLNFIRKH